MCFLGALLTQCLLIVLDSVPPNVEFIIDDIEADWAFKNPFDFIYIRMMSGSIKDWKRLFRQSYE